jgi:hypothetical protein
MDGVVVCLFLHDCISPAFFLKINCIKLLSLRTRNVLWLWRDPNLFLQKRFSEVASQIKEVPLPVGKGTSLPFALL